MTELCAIFIRQIRERNEDCYEILFKEETKMKINKKTLLTVASAVCGAGSFVVSVLLSKDQNEEVAQRAADILEERQKDSSEE